VPLYLDWMRKLVARDLCEPAPKVNTELTSSKTKSGPEGDAHCSHVSSRVNDTAVIAKLRSEKSRNPA